MPRARSITMYLRSAVACAVSLLPPLTAQTIAWVEGPTPDNLAVRSVAEASPTAPPTTLLSGVELLPIEITNRTAQQGLRDDVARLVERRGIRRVELDGNGQLFAYRRAGGGFWGFLWVRGDGVPVVVLEETGIGTGGTATPFCDRIGVAPDGRHAVVPRLDGAIDVVRLDGRSYASTGAPSRRVAVPGMVDPLSICVGRTHAWYAAQDDRVWRLALADAATPADVTPAGPAGSRLKPEFAPSVDGRAAVFLYGPQRLFSIYIVGEVGPAVLLPPPPSKYEEPGYLPETPLGPRLLLNDDATRLLYVDGSLRDEIFVLDVSGVLPTTHWSGDPNFQPYIGVIILPVAMGSTFVAGLGDPGLFDLHAAAAGNPGTANLTRTCAATAPPWDAGNLVVTDSTILANGTLLAGLVASNPPGSPIALVRFDPIGPTVVAMNLRERLRRGAAAPGGARADYLAPSFGGDVLVEGSTGLPVLAAPPGIRLTTSVTAPGFRAFSAYAGPLRAAIFRLDGGTLIAAPGTGIRDVLVSPGGGLVLDVAGAGLTLFDPSGVYNVSAGPSNRVVISGAGTGDA